MFQSYLQTVRVWFDNHPIIRSSLLRIGIIFGLYTLRSISCICYYKYYRYPPYISLGYPLLGCIPLFTRDPHQFASSIVCNDGQLSLTTVPLGLQNVIFVNDNKTAKKLLRTREIGMMRHLEGNQHQLSSFLMINGHKWLHQRKFLVSTFGLISRTSFTHLSVKDLFERDLFPNYIDKAIKTNNGKLLVKEYCEFVSFYAIFTAIFGNHLRDLQTMHCPFYIQYKSLYQQKETSFSLYVAYETIINIKIPQIIFERLFGIKQVHEQLIKNLKSYLMEHEIVKASADKKTVQWNKQNKNKSFMVNKIFMKDMNVEQITADVYAMLGAGMPTTAKHIEFGLVMLCKYAKIQTKIYNELTKFVEYKPSLLNDLHILRAFVHEILRFAVILPLGLPHKCINNDVEINGYTIYKGSTVIINHLSIHRDHQRKDCHKFNINRWLDKNGKFNKMHKVNKLLVFGLCGNRCVGQKIAMQMMYTFFALLIRKYVIYNNNLPETITRNWGINRGILPQIPIYFKHRRRTSQEKYT